MTSFNKPLKMCTALECYNACQLIPAQWCLQPHGQTLNHTATQLTAELALCGQVSLTVLPLTTQSLPQSSIEVALIMAGCMCCSRATVSSCSRVRSGASRDSSRKWLPRRKQLSSMSGALMCSAGLEHAGDWLHSCLACCMSLSAHEATAGSCSESLPGSCRTGRPSELNTTQPVCPGRRRRAWMRCSLSKPRALCDGRVYACELQPGIAGRYIFTDIPE